MYDEYFVDDNRYIMRYGMGADIYLIKSRYKCSEVLKDELLLKDVLRAYELQCKKTFFIEVEFSECELYLIDDVKKKIDEVISEFVRRKEIINKNKKELFKIHD